MSTAMAVAAATEALRGLLQQWVTADAVHQALGFKADVWALPPDQIALSPPEAKPGLNLFLHRISLNQGWRNVDLPCRDSAGQRVGNPPLPVDLHFVLSAYGLDPLQPEKLLGHGMQAFHHHPVITRAQLTSLLSQNPQLAASGLARQVDQLRIAPETITGEEASDLWSAFQAKYRLSFYYWVTVVLIDDTASARAVLPVLTRGEPLPDGKESGAAIAPSLQPRYPVLTALHPENNQPVAVSDGDVTVDGELLAGASVVVRLVGRRNDRLSHIVVGEVKNSRQFAFTVPSTVAVGTYELTVEVQQTTSAPVQTTNRLPLTVAPSMTNLPLTVSRDPGTGTATVTIECRPPVQAGQHVSLILGTQETLGGTSPTTPAQLQFNVLDAQAGSYLARLRVDGVESILVDRTQTPPIFDTRMRVTIQ